MFDVLLITLPVFLIIAMGYGAGILRFFPINAEMIFNRFVFYVALPIYLFKTMAVAPLDQLGDFNYIASFALSLLLTALLSFILARVFFKQSGRAAVFSLMGGSYTNAAFVGIPIMAMVFGSPLPVIMVVLFQLTCVMTCILVVLDVMAKKTQNKASLCFLLPRILATNPIVLAVILGVVWRLFLPDLPDVLLRVCDLLGSAAIPLALFTLGLSLQQTAQVKLSPEHHGQVLCLSIMKTCIHPIIAAILGFYVFELTSQWQQALILSAAMPTAVNHFIIAQKHGVFVARAGRIVLLTSVISMVTVTGLLWFWQ